MSWLMPSYSFTWLPHYATSWRHFMWWNMCMLCHITCNQNTIETFHSSSYTQTAYTYGPLSAIPSLSTTYWYRTLQWSVAILSLYSSHTSSISQSANNIWRLTKQPLLPLGKLLKVTLDIQQLGKVLKQRLISWMNQGACSPHLFRLSPISSQTQIK